MIRNIGTLVRDASRIERNVDLLIRDGRVSAVGPDLGRTAPDGTEIIDASGKTVIPGFVNAHTHLYQSFLRGRTDTLALKAWSEAVTFPFANLVHQRHWHQGDIEGGYLWTLLSCMEMIRSGITCVVDMDLTLDSVFQGMVDSGLRGVGAVTAVNRWVPPQLDQPMDERKRDILAYIEKWHQRKGGQELLKVFIAPSTPFTCTEDFLLWQMDVAERYDLGVQIHVSETRWEVEQSLQEHGLTPLAYLESIGFLRKPVMAVHCVHLTEEEIDLAVKRSVVPVYNPKSNMKLGSGVAPIPRMLRAGLAPALATDGAASNDLLNMFEEMRTGAGLQKAIHQDPAAITAEDLFSMATLNGAMAVGLDGGTLDPGKNADFVILDMERPWSSPVHDPLQNLVYCGCPGNVESVFVGGVSLLLNGAFTGLDEGEIFRRARKLFEEKFGAVRGSAALDAEF